MIKIEALTLEDAYKNAASTLECSVTELKIEVVQYPTKGLLGLFRKSAIIVAMRENIQNDSTLTNSEALSKPKAEEVQEEENTILEEVIAEPEENLEEEFDEESQEIYDSVAQIALEIQDEINELFDLTCFDIDAIRVSVYDETTLLIEFQGEDAALLIGKEGYRYKALSYMLFNWINAKYQLQLRLEIAEFLKNQEESVSRYLESVKESIDRDGRAQTKILDGVLVQIALRELRNMYPDKYVAIRSTRDGLKYIIVNDYHSN